MPIPPIFISEENGQREVIDLLYTDEDIDKKSYDTKSK